jgi:hypothetical protein
MDVLSLAGALSYINNPGFSVLEQPQYQVTIQMQDKCGTATTVVEVKICDTEAPKLNYGATSATIVEQQVIDCIEGTVKRKFI